MNNETQIEMIFDLTEECPVCGKTELTDKDKSSIIFKDKCKS